jgi:hypothetical protein
MDGTFLVCVHFRQIRNKNSSWTLNLVIRSEHRMCLLHVKNFCFGLVIIVIVIVVVVIICSSVRSLSLLQAFSIRSHPPLNTSAHSNFFQLLSEWISSICFLVSPFLYFLEDSTEVRPFMAVHHPSSVCC